MQNLKKEISILEEFKVEKLKQEKDTAKKEKKEKQKALKLAARNEAKEDVRNENNNKYVEETVNTDDDVFNKDPPLVSAKDLKAKGNGSKYERLMKDFVPVKSQFFPIIPLPQNIEQRAIEKYLEIFGTHKCSDCKEFKFNDKKRSTFYYCKNYFIQFTLLNAEFRSTLRAS